MSASFYVYPEKDKSLPCTCVCYRHKGCMGAAIGNICTDGIQFDEPTVKHVVFSAEDLRALADWMDARKKQEGGAE